MTPHQFDNLLQGLSASNPLTPELALTRLRERGASMVQAIKAMTVLFGMTLGTAKEVAARHPAWQSIHSAAEPLHDALARHAAIEDNRAVTSPSARPRLRP